MSVGPAITGECQPRLKTVLARRTKYVEATLSGDRHDDLDAAGQRLGDRRLSAVKELWPGVTVTLAEGAEGELPAATLGERNRANRGEHQIPTREPFVLLLFERAIREWRSPGAYERARSEAREVRDLHHLKENVTGAAQGTGRPLLRAGGHLPVVDKHRLRLAGRWQVQGGSGIEAATQEH
jgi:hypothetical protein